jgi:hypothetical protein
MDELAAARGAPLDFEQIALRSTFTILGGFTLGAAFENVPGGATSPPSLLLCFLFLF